MTSEKISIDSSTTSPSLSQSSVLSNKRKMNDETTVKCRKYKNDYSNFRFKCTSDERNQKPQCIICGITLSNESMIPNKLLRHLE